MYTPHLLSRRAFSISTLSIEHHASSWNSTAEYDQLVALEWAKVLRDARTRIWDGTYYRVLNPSAFLEEKEPAPVLLGTIPFRYIATFPSLSQAHSRLALDPLNHLSTIALIRTTDDLYVFGVRSRSGALDLIGGGAQRDEMVIDSGADLERNLYKEIFEETGLSKTEVRDLAGVGVVLSGTSNVLIVGHARLQVDSDEVQRRFEQRTDNEMSRLVLVADKKVRQFLMQMRDYRSHLAQLDW